MSSSSGWPASTTRSPGSWCGDAEFGPLATIQNEASSWPSLTSHSRTSRAMSASVRPMRRPLATLVTARSAACAALRRSSISSASLTARRSDSTVDARPNAASGICRLKSEQEGRPQPIRYEEPAQPTPRPAERAELDLGPAVALVQEPGHDLERVFCLFPGDQVDQPGLRRRAAACGASSRRGTISEARPRSGMTSIVSRSRA